MSDESNSNIKNLLPSYEIIYERSKRWSSMFDKYLSKTDDISESVSLVGPSEFLDENESESNTAESVDISEFEDNLEEDDREFNYKEILEQTMAVVKERKKKLEESGIDLDICDVTDVRDKVGLWLANSQVSEEIRNDTNFENQHLKIQKGESGRSRRKVTKTMMIKTIEITETKKGQNVSKHRFNRLTSGDYDLTSKSRKDYDKRNKIKSRTYYSSPTIQGDTNYKKYHNYNYSKNPSNRKRKHYPIIDSSSDFVSSSSSSSDTASPRKYKKKNFRNQRQKAKECSTNVNKVSFHPESIINSTEITSCQSPTKSKKQLNSFTRPALMQNKSNTQIPMLRKICENIVNDYENEENHISTNIESMKPISQCSSQLVESNTNVRPNTTLRNEISPNKKAKVLEPLNWSNSFHQNRNNSKSSSPEKTYKDIFVYSAKDSNKFVDSIIDNKVHLKKEHLINALGEKLTEHFLKNKNTFLYQCDVSSDLVYELPQFSETTDSSGDDIMNLPQKFGKLTEIKRPA